MNKKPMIIAVAAAAVLAAGGAYLYLNEEPEQTLSCSGNIDIVNVNTSFRVAGRLSSLAKDEGDLVQAGELLGELDAEPYQLALQRAESDCREAETAVEAAKAQKQAADATLDLHRAGYRSEEIAQAQAELEAQQVIEHNAATEYARQKKLLAQHAVSQQAFDAAERVWLSQQKIVASYTAKLTELQAGFRPEELRQAEAQDAQAAAGVTQAEAKLETARTAVAQAQLNLADTKLTAPAEAMVMTRAVEPGTMLAAGNTVLTLSLRHPVRVRAYIDEPDLGRIHLNQRVTVVTDDGKRYQGTIGFISPQAEFTPKTVETAEIRTTLVYRFRVVVDEPCEGLNQGMPVRVLIAE